MTTPDLARLQSENARLYQRIEEYQAEIERLLAQLVSATEYIATLENEREYHYAKVPTVGPEGSGR